MSVDWQTAVVLTLVTTATVYVARTAWRSIVERKAAACGGCGTCPAAKQPDQINVIAVEQLLRSPATEQVARNGETTSAAGTAPKN